MHSLAWFCFAKSALYGHACAINDIGAMHLNGLCVKKDVDLGIKLIKKAANAWCKKAQRNLGIIFQNEEFIPQNLKESAMWLKKAAQNKFQDAIERLKILEKNK